jgi:hypothetical protein
VGHAYDSARLVIALAIAGVAALFYLAITWPDWLPSQRRSKVEAPRGDELEAEEPLDLGDVRERYGPVAGDVIAELRELRRPQGEQQARGASRTPEELLARVPRLLYEMHSASRDVAVFDGESAYNHRRRVAEAVLRLGRDAGQPVREAELLRVSGMWSLLRNLEIEVPDDGLDASTEQILWSLAIERLADAFTPYTGRSDGPIPVYALYLVSVVCGLFCAHAARVRRGDREAA